MDHALINPRKIGAHPFQWHIVKTAVVPQVLHMSLTASVKRVVPLFLARRIAEVSAELLQAIVHQRYKLRRSIVVTSNRVVQDWGKYLGDATMGSTILDRLMHRCSMLDFEGKSYRLRETAARIAAPAPTDS